MPFYDEFDLSTVDVLLISQYVYAYSASQLRYFGGGAGASLQSEQMRKERWPCQHRVYQNQSNIICILSTRLR